MISRPIHSNFAGLLMLLWLLAGHAAARALDVKAIALSVSDLDRSVAFFEQALNSRKTGECAIGVLDYSLDCSARASLVLTLF